MNERDPYDRLSLLLIACAVLAVCCWLQSARQLHRTVEWSADQLSTVPRLHSTSEITQARAHLDDVLYVARLYDEPIACSGTAVSGRFLSHAVRELTVDANTSGTAGARLYDSQRASLLASQDASVNMGPEHCCSIS